MSEETTPNPQTEPKKEARFRITFDDDQKRSVMFLEVPLEKAAQDQTINGVIYLQGFFEEAKNQALAAVMFKKQEAAQAKAQTKILRPSDAKVPFVVH